MLVQSQLMAILNDLFNQKGRLRKGGLQLIFHCPFCVDKNLVTQKLEVAINGPKIGNYHCWRCNTKGTTFGTLLKKLNAPFHYREAIFKLTGDIRLIKYQQLKNKNDPVHLPNEFHSLLHLKNSPEYKNAMSYLKRRGVLQEDILRYNIGYCESGQYAYHIIIPSYDANGNLNFFMGRRYYNTEGVLPHKKPEVPMDSIIGFEIFINWSEPVNLVEGVFDAIAIRNNTIPLFGKYPSKKLREMMIVNGTKRVNMILDSDAIEDAIKNCKMMIRLGVDVYLVKLNGKDPSVLGFEKMNELIRNSKQFEFEDLLNYELEL